MEHYITEKGVSVVLGTKIELECESKGTPLEKILYARENVDFGVLIPDDRSLRDLRDAIVWCVRSFPANFPVFRSLRLVRERRRLHTFTAGRPCVCPSF